MTIFGITGIEINDNPFKCLRDSHPIQEFKTSAAHF